MAEHLARTDKLQALRTMRFPRYFTEDVSQLIDGMTKEVIERYLKV